MEEVGYPWNVDARSQSTFHRDVMDKMDANLCVNACVRNTKKFNHFVSDAADLHVKFD